MLLADQRRRIASAPQHRWERVYPVEQGLMMDVVLEAVHAVLVRVEARVDHGAAWTAGRDGRIALREARALARQTVDPRRRDRDAVATKIEPLIVGKQ